MELEVLNGIVERFIVKKYPWIKSFKWSNFFVDMHYHWSLGITPEDDFLRGNELKQRMLESEITKEVRSLFEMLGPKPYEHFEEVNIWFNSW